MRNYHLIMIDWSGPCLFGEQQLALRNIVALYVRRGTYGPKVNFTHLLIEGKLTFRKTSVFGIFSGNRFFADFGSHNGSPWHCEFLLPFGKEHIEIDEDSILFTSTPYGDEESIKQVDVAQGRVSEANIQAT